MGGEESSTGHQLLSDYIIPDIKTTHTAWVPAGGRERRAGRSWANLAPKSMPIFHPAPAGGRGKAPRCPRSLGAAPRISVLRRGAPWRRRGGTAAGAARAGALGRASPQHPEAPRIPDRLPAWRGAQFRSTFTWSSPRPPPARPRRLRRLRGGAQELVGLAKRRGGGAGVPGSAARSLPGAGGGFVCAGGVLRTLRLEAASLRS